MWIFLFKSGLSKQKGTLPHLKILLNCAINLDPAKNMKACEDFFLTVLHAHVIAAANHLLESSLVNTDKVEVMAKEIIIRYVCFHPDVKVKTTDTVFLYSLQVLTLGLIWHGFNDSIKEGDGDRILTYWKFLLVIFKVGKRRNYCKEAMNLLMQYYFLLPKRLAEQLKWSRCINSRGVIGGNVPADLHLEHLNRRLKDVLSNLESNVTPRAIDCASKSLGVVHQICQSFERENNAEKQSGRHTRPSFAKECKMICDELRDQKTFEEQHDRRPTALRYVKSLLQQCSTSELKAWIPVKMNSYKW